MDKSQSVEKPKVVFVLGATGTGKSKLAIALAKRFNGEVINADKIQVHDGAPIITNMVTKHEKAGVPHHLLGVLPPDAEFTAEDFRREAAGAVARVLSTGRLPVVAGGSNRYIEALVEGDGAAFRHAHDALFLWVDAAPELLKWYTALRVDDMVARGLVDEARAAFDASRADYSRGVHRAIGLPEMHDYLLAEREGTTDEAELAGMLARAISEIKGNTFILVCAQVEKIRRLNTLDGWDVRHIDVTPVFVRMAEGDACDKLIWETLVWQPCEEMVRRFLETPAGPFIRVDGNASINDGCDGELTDLAAVTNGDGGGSDDSNANIAGGCDGEPTGLAAVTGGASDDSNASITGGCDGEPTGLVAVTNGYGGASDDGNANIAGGFDGEPTGLVAVTGGDGGATDDSDASITGGCDGEPTGSVTDGDGGTIDDGNAGTTATAEAADTI